jgi:hypothetical protein
MRIKLTRQEMAAVDQAAALRWQLARASGVANQNAPVRVMTTSISWA